MSTGCELEEVEREDGAGLDAGDVAESKRKLLAVLGWVVDDQWTAALTVTASTKLTLTRAELAGSLDLADISTGSNSLQESKSGRCTGNGSTGENLGVDDEGNFGDGGDLVTTGKEESWDR